MSKKHFYATILLVIIFIMANKIFAQDTESETLVDSIDIKENLLDSNHVYQQKFDSLSKDGEWVEIKKSDFVKEVDGGSAEAVDYESSSDVEVIYVWRPRTVDYGWNPYCNGRWEFTYYGWCWVSDYSWGWACYNYGRWYWSAFYGWVWLPGRVWACNWVTWRHCGSYWGWYPTCPRIHWRNHRGHWCRNYTFRSNPRHWVLVNDKDFTKKIEPNTIVKQDKNSDIMKNSTRVSNVNITKTSGVNVKYTGPEVSNISKTTGTPIEPKNIKINPTKGITKVEEPRITRSTRTGTSNTREGEYNSPRNNNPTKETPTTRSPRTESPRTPKTDNPGTRTHTPRNDGTKTHTPRNDGTRSNTPRNEPRKSDTPKRNDSPKSDRK